MAGRGYGISDYGESLYGQTKYLDGVAAVAASASTSSACQRIALGSLSITPSATVSSPTGEFMVDASANTIQGSSSVASAAVEVFDGLASGGGSAVGSTITATRVREASASSTASASPTASLQFITNASASVSASASNTAACERARYGVAEVAGVCTPSASANITAVGSLAVSGSTTIFIDYTRERSVAANAVQGSSGFASVNGREKWEPLPYTSTNWSDIAA